MLTDHTPEQLKFKCCLWTRKSVIELIKREFGIEMPLRTVGEYLKRWGFTVQRPAKQAMNQKNEQVEKWLNNQYPSIRDNAKKKKQKYFGQVKQPFKTLPITLEAIRPKA